MEIWTRRWTLPYETCSNLNKHIARVSACSQKHSTENERMKTNQKLALAVMAGVSIGIAAAKLIHAQQVKTPRAYVIAEVEVTDPTTFQKYAVKVPETQVPFDGHSLVRGGKIQAIEGEAPKRIVVMVVTTVMKKVVVVMSWV